MEKKLSYKVAEDILQNHCDVEHPKYEKPWMYNGYLYATGGHTLVRIKSDIVDEPEKIDIAESPLAKIAACLFVEKKCSHSFTVEQIKDILIKEFGWKGEGKHVECSECDGSGVVSTDYLAKEGKIYDVVAECPICDGEGIVAKAPNKFMKFGDVFVNADFIAEAANHAFKLGLPNLIVTSISDTLQLRIMDGVDLIIARHIEPGCQAKVAEVELEQK